MGLEVMSESVHVERPLDGAKSTQKYVFIVLLWCFFEPIAPTPFLGGMHSVVDLACLLSCSVFWLKNVQKHPYPP
jgi:hypothetical protein